MTSIRSRTCAAVYDLKNVNPEAEVSVKLVSEVGVGTVATGVAKCKADHVTISGFEGGTGASPLTSIKHAGSPGRSASRRRIRRWCMNGLRSRIAVQVDGGLRTGRDVVVGALLGADEFGFATAPLDRRWLHHDAQVPSQHLPGRRRDAGPGAAQALRRPARARHQLFLLRRRGSARVDGRARLSHVRRNGRPATDARQATGSSSTGKAQGLDFSKLFFKPAPWPEDTIHHSQRRITDSTTCSTAASSPRREAAIERAQARASRPRHPQRRSLDRRHAVGRDRPALRPCRPARRDDPYQAQGHGGPELRRLPRQGRDAASSRERPTTMSARASRAAASSSIRRARRRN